MGVCIHVCKVCACVYISEVGGFVQPGNLNGSCERDPVAGALEFD